MNVSATNDRNRPGFALTDVQVRQMKANEAYPPQGRAVVVRRHG